MPSKPSSNRSPKISAPKGPESKSPAHVEPPVADVEERGLGFERLVFFSDAVFAIAITLLALEVKVGEIAETMVDAELPRQLVELWPQLLGYLLGFTVIGAYWMSHHRMFTFIQRYDRRLIWLNLLFLAMIAISPFPATVIGEYGFHQPAQIFYALSVALTGFAKELMWWYASHNHRLVDPELPSATIRQLSLRGLAVPLLFLFSIALTWLNPAVPVIFWCLTPVISSVVFRNTEVSA